MNYQIHFHEKQILAGTTLRDFDRPEENNLALHIAKDPVKVIANRKALAATLQTDLDYFVIANQTHSANFHRVTKQDAGKGTTTMQDAIPDTDALYTYEPDIVLGSFTADCVPVTFYNETSGIIGVIHSGWPGTTKEITLKLFHQLIDIENNHPEDFHVHLGPAISQDKFEVDMDVQQRYERLGYADAFIYERDATGKYHIDNQQTVREQCILLGIPESQITTDPICTFQSEKHFSHRQDNQTGRHLSFIVRRSCYS